MRKLARKAAYGSGEGSPPVTPICSVFNPKSETQMSISTLESRDTVRALDAMNARQDRIEAAERAVIDDFTEACRRGDANAMVPWAGLTTDWAQVKAPVIAGLPLPMRAKQLHEVMVESLDYPDGPDMSEAMQLILNVAYGSDCQANLAVVARKLVQRMAQTHARHSVVVE